MRKLFFLSFLLLLVLSGGMAIPAAPSKERTAALLLYPASPCYFAAGQGSGMANVAARINLDPAQRVGLRLKAELTGTAGKLAGTASADASRGELVELHLSVPVVSPAAFLITVQLIDRTGKEISKASTDVHVRRREESTVKIGPDGFLRVSGKPHFPIGMYNSGHYEEMSKAGFSVTHNYGISGGEANEPINQTDSHLKELLDHCSANGLRMMVELPRKAIEQAQWRQIRRRIETFRYHPGLLCWGSEERVARGTASLKNIA